MFDMLELIIINYNMYELICNKYILYNRLSNYIRYEVIKLCIGFNMCHEK
jgi:predicted ATP-grasp superfamily ATP-dependent carboligase